MEAEQAKEVEALSKKNELKFPGPELAERVSAVKAAINFNLSKKQRAFIDDARRGNRDSEADKEDAQVYLDAQRLHWGRKHEKIISDPHHNLLRADPMTGAYHSVQPAAFISAVRPRKASALQPLDRGDQYVDHEGLSNQKHNFVIEQLELRELAK